MRRDDDFSPKTIETLAKRVGCRCSNPDCHQLTVGPHSEPTKTVNIGVAAHITAAAPGGKRYNASLSSEQRKSIENGIWLCQTHAKLIDSDEQKYSVKLLLSWKYEAERQAQSELEQSTPKFASSEPTDFSVYLESVTNHCKTWWKDYAFMDEINEETWFHFTLSSTTKDKPHISGQQQAEQQPQLVLNAIQAYASEKILIVGAPGAGKSTLLAQVLGIAAEKAKNEPSAPIPVLIEMRDFEATSDNPSIRSLIINNLTSHDGRLNDDTLTELLTGTKRRLLLLADGLNEKPKVKRNLKQFCRNILLIATGRNDGDGWEIDRKLELQPLSKDEVTKFFQERLPDSDRAQLQSLSDRVQDFGQTPLIVWMLYSIFQATGSTPATRGEAYQTFTTRYEEQAKERVDLTESPRVLLGKLAFEMMRSQNPDDPTDFELKIPAVDAEIILGGKATLKQILNHLLRQQGTKISFCHQSLQEYYAAEHLLLELIRNPEWLEKQAGEEYSLFQRHYLNYKKWTEPVALMMGLVDNEVLAVRVVEQAIKVNLKLTSQLVRLAKTEHKSNIVVLIKSSNLSNSTQHWLFSECELEATIPKLFLIALEENSGISQSAALSLVNFPSERLPNEVSEFLIKTAKIKMNRLSSTNNSSLTLGEIKQLQAKYEANMTPLEKLFERQLGAFIAGFIIDLWGICSSSSVCLLLSVLLDAWKNPYSIEDFDLAYEVMNDLKNSRDQLHFNEKLSQFLSKGNRSTQDMLAALLRFTELCPGKTPDFRSVLMALVLCIRDDTSIVLQERHESILELTSIAFSEKLIATQDLKFIQDVFEIVAAIQTNCKFYNYEIQQEKLRKADRPSLEGGGDDRYLNVTYNIDRVGNLNTGTINVHGNQNGEQ
jgi:energy-coupling factor transporter ATP-binding protein EcfA2